MKYKYQAGDLLKCKMSDKLYILCEIKYEKYLVMDLEKCYTEFWMISGADNERYVEKIA